jgi:hypothetical protein
VLGGDPLDHRAKRAAMTTPRSPVVDEHRYLKSSQPRPRNWPASV